MTEVSSDRQVAEQLRYAQVLNVCARAGLLALVLSFAAYVLGFLPSQVPVAQLPQLWGEPASHFLQLTHNPAGWSWVHRLSQGDADGLASIAFLASCSAVCLLAVLPIYLRRGERIYVLLCLAQVAVMVLAASGLLGRGS